jgi:hypothetical protein
VTVSQHQSVARKQSQMVVELLSLLIERVFIVLGLLCFVYVAVLVGRVRLPFSAVSERFLDYAIALLPRPQYVSAA